jgi:hypothetical protein
MWRGLTVDVFLTTLNSGVLTGWELKTDVTVYERRQTAAMKRSRKILRAWNSYRAGVNAIEIVN